MPQFIENILIGVRQWVNTKLENISYVVSSHINELNNKLDSKQDTLTAGSNINITNNVISATGTAATVTVGTTTTGEPGTNASVTNGGTSSAAVLNFTIPRGATGATGADGTTPHIDATSKHWMLGTTDTGVVAEGQNGANGTNGTNGTDGITPHIDSTTKHWMIGSQDTGIVAEGINGTNGTDGTNGTNGTSAYWFSGTAVTGTGTGIAATVAGSKAGDMYLNTSTCNIYKATATNTWNYVCVLQGGTDTKNTTGSTNSTSKLYLVGALEQSANPQTYSNTSVYETNGILHANKLEIGSSVTASGDSSVAEGIGSIAYGSASHAQGRYAYAYGDGAHAEGTTVIAGYAYGVENNTPKYAYGSHGEGLDVAAVGMRSHAEGQGVASVGSTSHAEGGGVEGTDYWKKFVGGTIFNVTSGSSAATISETNVLLFSETVSELAIGDIIIYEGTSVVITKIEGTASPYSLTFDRPWHNKTFSNVDISTINSGENVKLFVFRSSVSLGGYSHIEGEHNIAYGRDSHAEGNWTKTIGNYSHAEGSGTAASGNYSHAEGRGSTSIGDASHSEGGNVISYGEQSHAEGYGVWLTHYKWHVISVGMDTVTVSPFASSTPSYSFIKSLTTNYIFHITNISGDSGSTFILTLEHNGIELSDHFSVGSAFALSETTVAIGHYSHAEGEKTASIGIGSHSEGCYTEANGRYSHTEGVESEAIGDYSHAEGYFTTASGSCSHAGGFYTIANQPNMTAIGQCNESGVTNELFTIGTGYRTSGGIVIRNTGLKVVSDNNSNGTCKLIVNGEVTANTISVTTMSATTVTTPTLSVDTLSAATVSAATLVTTAATATVNSVPGVYLGTPIGTVVMWMGNNEPDGWLLCNGRTIVSSHASVSADLKGADYDNLYTVLGVPYGSGGIKRLPDLRQKFPLGASGTTSSNDEMTAGGVTYHTRLGQTGGISGVKLTQGQMPSHNHTMNFIDGEMADRAREYTGETVTDLVTGFQMENSIGGTHTPKALKNVDRLKIASDSTQYNYIINYTGGGAAHNNIPPYYSINFIIKYK